MKIIIEMSGAQYIGLVVAIICLSQPILSFKFGEMPLLGGYIQYPVEECEFAVEKAHKKSMDFLDTYRIQKCEIQVVAGKNFRVTFIKKTKRVRTCDIVIAMDLQDKYFLTTRPNESDCINQARELDILIGSTK